MNSMSTAGMPARLIFFPHFSFSLVYNKQKYIFILFDTISAKICLYKAQNYYKHWTLLFFYIFYYLLTVSDDDAATIKAATSYFFAQKN